jgi:hypothetical protein
MEVEGLGPGGDYKLWPGGGRQWDWTETGTHHIPGIQPQDVQELLDNGSRIIVLSRGQWCRLQTCPETLEMLEKADIPVYREETSFAVAVYNRLAGTEPVGGLFHSTC